MNRFKSIVALLLSVSLIFTLSACATGGSAGTEDGVTLTQTSPVNQTPAAQTTDAAAPESETEQPGIEPSAEPTEPSEAQGSKILVAVFSAAGNTAPLAETVAELLDADLYVITPAEPYTTK